jgi:hypothetical protein
VNCLVEVYVDFFGPSDPADVGTSPVNNTAVDLAHPMMDKVSSLS